MSPDDTLKAALAALAKRDDTATSAALTRLRDGMDIAGAHAALQALEARRYGMLLNAGDAAIEKVDLAMRAAIRDIDRRKAAAQALGPLIEDAKAKEARADLEREGAAQAERQLRLFARYRDLDAAALQLVDAKREILAEEAAMAEANARFKEAKRTDLLRALPMAELAKLTGQPGERLPWLSRFVCHGYMAGPRAHVGVAEDQVIPARLRFGRFAELLPGWVPPEKPVVVSPVAEVKAEAPPADVPDELDDAEPIATEFLRNWDGSTSAVPAPPVRRKQVA